MKLSGKLKLLVSCGIAEIDMAEKLEQENEFLKAELSRLRSDLYASMMRNGKYNNQGA